MRHNAGHSNYPIQNGDEILKLKTIQIDQTSQNISFCFHKSSPSQDFFKRTLLYSYELCTTTCTEGRKPTVLFN